MSQVEGLTEQEDELFIITQQHNAVALKKEFDRLDAEAKDVEKKARDARGQADYAKEKLFATLKFLSIHNADAHDDWFGEFGFERPKDA